MKTYGLLLLIPLALAAFVSFWCLVVKLVSLVGWRRLSRHFEVAGLPPGPRFRLGQATVGGVRYKGAIQTGYLAGATSDFIELFRG